MSMRNVTLARGLPAHQTSVVIELVVDCRIEFTLRPLALVALAPDVCAEA